MKLNLGVIDQLYENGVATGKVANILEAEYGIMGIFAAQNLQYIADQLAQSITDNLEQIVQTGNLPTGLNIFAQGENNIAQKFRAFLDANGTGIVTKASTIGISKRFKDAGNTKGLRVNMPGSAQVRPSFIDTGLYQNSMRAWIEETNPVIAG